MGLLDEQSWRREVASDGSSYRFLAAIVVFVLLLALATASLLPLIETNIWWIRYLDFPRVQLAIAASIALLLYLGLRIKRQRSLD
ncbi:hypothetical protein [Rhizobium halophilum]|uniref:hypothetical protein n=1 Tax=Rhizobium halophilum TaxID=2846852 RepID=UPI001EFD397D|nr:hypothetical protein [Rhizobium halophilum]MCF6369891.1 hypothetical protein [Rhizobium halophilum]